MSPEQRAALMESLSLLAGLLLVVSPDDQKLIRHNIQSLKSAFPGLFEKEMPDAATN